MVWVFADLTESCLRMCCYIFSLLRISGWAADSLSFPLVQVSHSKMYQVMWCDCDDLLWCHQTYTYYCSTHLYNCTVCVNTDTASYCSSPSGADLGFNAHRHHVDPNGSVLDFNAVTHRVDPGGSTRLVQVRVTMDPDTAWILVDQVQVLIHTDTVWIPMDQPIWCRFSL